MTMSYQEKTVVELYQCSSFEKEDVIMQGWVRTNRDNGSVGFIELNDGTYFKNIQVVYSNKTKDYALVSHISTGCAIEVKGTLVLTPNMKQPFEIQADEVNLLGSCDETYPLQKKRHSFEYLRDIAHLRPRANAFQATFRVRSVLSMAINQYFFEHDFVYVHTPEITSNDAEGAGETFNVTSSGKDPNAIFGGKKACLTVSGQLHVESFALAFRKVYTFGPTFRAEHSNTPRHAEEFWMVEPEIAFADLNDDMDLMESFVKYIIEFVINHCPEEMKFFNDFIDKELMNRLNAVLVTPFVKCSYTKAIDLLLEAVKSGHKFDSSDIHWGMDLQSEHERYITEQVFKGPVFLTDYPSEIKAFYMRQNDDGKTVAACDLLVPYVGELIGGSQREERFGLLEEKMKKQGNEKDLEWYLDLRKYGGCKHAGFGLGFERFLMYITGMENIRDVLPYPRTPRN